MPKKLIFANFRGEAPPGGETTTDLSVGPTGSYAYGSIINPITKPGLLQPGWGYTDCTNISSVKNLVKRFRSLDQTVAKTYGIEDRSGGVDSQLHEIGTLDITITASGNFPHTIAAAGIHSGHTTFEGCDLIFYEISGSPYLVYSWNDNTDGGIGRVYALTGTPFDDDYMDSIGSTPVLSKTNPHPMIVGDNTFLYVADGNAIHKFDGATPAYTKNVIDLPKEWVIEDWAKNSGFMWILANKVVSGSSKSVLYNREVAVYIWNYLSVQAGNETGFSNIIPLEEDSWGATIFNYEGVPHVITVGGAGKTRVRRWNGSTFEVKYDFYSRNDKPERGGVEMYSKHLIFGSYGSSATSTSGGKVTSYGPLTEGVGNLPNTLASIGTKIGAISKRATGSYFVSYRTGSSYRIAYMSAGLYDTTGTPTIHTLIEQLPYMAHITRMNVLFPEFTATTGTDTLAINLYKNFHTTSSVTKTLTYSTDSERGWYSVPLDIKNCHAIKLKAEWSITNNDEAITPYRVELEYSETSKEK